MFRSVEMPLWLLVLILAFAAVTFASHFLFPSVRWFFRRRMERVVARLNERLVRPIEPFKLLRRQDMIQRLLYDPRVIEAVAEHAAETGVREDVAFEQARRYAREIVPSFSASAYFGFAIRLARRLGRAFYRVRLSHMDDEVVSAIGSDAAVIFVMNHRSNMDYVLITFLAAERSALSFAAGEWARVWPLSRLVRAMGAYFIRRRSRSTLYRRVLARYVQMATRNGVAQAVFPEGGLTLTGQVGAPKLGILNYVVSDFEPGISRAVIFIPVALNYDRVLEDRVLVAAAGDVERRFRFRWRDAARYFVKNIWQRLTGRFLRYGYASVSFGCPLPLAEFAAGQKGDITDALGHELMARIRAIMPVVPIPLLATLLLRAGTGLSRAELRDLMVAEATRLRAKGLIVEPATGDLPAEADIAINHLLMRNLVGETGGLITVTEGAAPLLRYYAASIEHHI